MKSFSQFILEEKHYSFVNELAIDIISKLSSYNKSNSYSLVNEYEYQSPFYFDLRIYCRWDDSPNLDEDSHFNELDWEKHRFFKNGYCINANTKFNKEEYFIPEIDLYLIINPSIKNINSVLFPRLSGILAHELRHLRQIGLNKEPFMGKVSSSSDRKKSLQNYKYFLLPEEIDSMVEDKYLQSKMENKPIDNIIHDYLDVFVKDGFMTNSEYSIVFNKWIKKTIELFPDAIFSDNVENILNKI